MIVIITLFYLSLATITVMVGWKLMKLRALKLSLIEGIEKEFHNKLYKKMHELWNIFRDKYLLRARIFFLAVFYAVAHWMLRTTLIAGQKIQARHRKWFDMVKGKGVVGEKGRSSFFLKDVAEYKKSLVEATKVVEKEETVLEKK
ncbi:MAG: hypothetical protein PHS95_00285 [Candidatus Pacebacteria bacterium]|nr:hypothetical protein [Candidatus Paceibacterota bacterium]